MKRSQISVLSRGSGGSCVVCGRREGTNALSEVRLFAFPLCEQRKNLWLQRCHLEPSDISSRAKICNHHFVSGSPARNKYETDYAPSLNLIDPPAIKDQQHTQNQPVKKLGRKSSSASSAKGEKRVSYSRARTTQNLKESSGDDDSEMEDDECCFEEVCDKEQCQQQATKLVELLVKVGTLERTICFLQHDLEDKDNEIAKLRAQLKKIPVTRIRAKAESQQRIIPGQRNESDLRKKSSALERKPRKTRRSPHESYASLKLRIRTSRIRYVSSTSSDECRSEYPNQLSGGKFSDGEAVEIVREVVRELVEEAVRRS